MRRAPRRYPAALKGTAHDQMDSAKSRLTGAEKWQQEIL